MSKPRYAWWGYVKDMIRKYPDRTGKDLSITQQKEFEAVREALEETEALHEGKTRLEIIKLVFWDKSHTLVGAAEKEYCSYETAVNYHRQFIKLVAQKFGIFEP